MASVVAPLPARPYPADHETSADRLSVDVPRARAQDTAAAVRRHLALRADAAWGLLCVVDEAGRLLGTLTPQELLQLGDEATVGQAMRPNGPRVPPGLDQEHVASHALHHGVAAMPVVGDDGRLVGVIGAEALMQVLRREHVEDLHRLAGISREAARARHAIEDPPLRRVRHRLPWLLVGLAGSVVATGVVARFEAALAAKPALACFVPGLVYLADAIGTQTEAVAVRGLSLSRRGLVHLAGGELRTGLLIGLILGLLAFPMVWVAFGELHLALAVTTALIAASAIASVLGLTLPWLLSRFRLDPAYGSGPLATIVQDVLSLLIYFGCVSAIVF